MPRCFSPFHLLLYGNYNDLGLLKINEMHHRLINADIYSSKTQSDAKEFRSIVI